MRFGEQHRAALARRSRASRTDASTAHTKLLRSLVRLTGRPAAGFKASVLDNGTVAVHGPVTTAIYPGDAWTTKVLRHLHGGFYDGAQPPGS